MAPQKNPKKWRTEEDIITESDVVDNKDFSSLQTKEFDLFGEVLDQQEKFNKKITILGSIMIGTYLFLVVFFFCIKVFVNYQVPYPDFLQRFETLVLLITGFFFGTRIINQYWPFKK